MGLILVDKSAWVRADLEEIERHGEPCLCAVTRLEILYSTTSPPDYVQQQAALALFRDLRVDAQTLAAAEGAQRELATRSQHRVSLPDLILGACAQQHGADILHVDRHFDTLATVFGFRSIRLPDQGTLAMHFGLSEAHCHTG